MTNKITLAMALGITLLVGTTTACVPDPCAGLTVTEREKEIIALGGEVEREVNDTECELSEDGRTWTEDRG